MKMTYMKMNRTLKICFQQKNMTGSLKSMKLEGSNPIQIIHHLYQKECKKRKSSKNCLIGLMSLQQFSKKIINTIVISTFERKRIPKWVKLISHLIVQSLMIKRSEARCQKWFPDLNYHEVPTKRIEKNMEEVRQRIKEMNQQLNKILVKNYRLISLPIRNAKAEIVQELRLLELRKKVNIKALQNSQREISQLQMTIRDMKERSLVIDTNQKMNQYLVQIQCLKQEVKQLSVMIIRNDKSQQEQDNDNNNKVTFEVLHKLKALIFYSNKKGEELQERLNLIEKNINEAIGKDEGVTKKMLEYKKIAEQNFYPVSLNKKGIQLHKQRTILIAQIDRLQKQVDLEEHNILRTAEMLNRQILEIKKQEIQYNNRIYTEESKISCLIAKMQYQISKCKKDQRIIRSVLQKYSEKNSGNNRLPRLTAVGDMKKYKSINGQNMMSIDSTRDKEKKERYFSKTPFKWKFQSNHNNKRLNTISNDYVREEEEIAKRSGQKMPKMLDLVTIKIENPLLRQGKNMKTTMDAVQSPIKKNKIKKISENKGNTTVTQIISPSDDNEFLQNEFY